MEVAMLLNKASVIHQCSSCGSKERIYTLKLISSGRSFPYPMYIPQIKELCQKCNRYIRFVPQSPELVNRFNNRLEEEWLVNA